ILASSGAAEPGSGGAAIAQKIGSLLLLQVAGAVQEEMSIRSFTAPAFSEYGPITMTGRFENTGTVHLKPRGFVLVKDVLGRETARLELPQLNVLPNSIRQVDTELPDKRLFGKYSATLTAIYGSTNEPLAYTTTFWVVPWKVLGATLIGLLILAFLLYLARRRLSLALSVLVTGKKR
ncbi:MAG: hypothetical protein U1C72_01310, partial [Candidatus Pacearchaeota archaeon]|nr:hypothetical protein [Candidatus Pacearchaeota archaeon]